MTCPGIDYKIPAAYYKHRMEGYTPLLSINGFVLAETPNKKTYAYKAVNPITGEAHLLYRARKRLEGDNLNAIANKMTALGLVSIGEVLKTQTSSRLSNEYETIKADLDAIFMHILPKHGFDVRTDQAELAHHMQRALYDRKISVSEAGVGIGKTMAFIVAALLIKIKKSDNSWIRNAYGYTKDFTEKTSMPVIISTAGIALQEAVVSDYIPTISRILKEYKIISGPLKAVVRKGKEHYVCDYRLNAFANCKKDKQNLQLQKLQNAPADGIDLDKAHGLDLRTKHLISVTDNCGAKCPIRAKCRYLSLLNAYMNPCIDFQVCNHNFLLADVIKRKQGGNPMLPNYQAVIIDEVHKFLPAARQMYGTGLSNTEPEALHGMLEKLPFVNEKKGRLACKYCQAALNFNDDLFKYLARSAAGFTQSGEIQDRAKTHIGKHAQIALRALSYNAGRLAGLLRENAADIKSADALYHSECIGLMHRFDALKKKADLFLSPEDMIYWLEAPFELNNKELRLASIPKDIDKRLYMDIWSKPFPKILTSGTIAVNGGFGYIKGQLGLNRVWKGGILETVKQAPFNYKEQCLLYISEKTPFPAPPEGIAGTASDNDLEKKYIDAVVKEINILITAACGHTAVLFTSYRVMGMVMSRFRNGRLPYPVFRLSKGEPFALEDFKASGNGVLFAAGTFWDGIDIPGDILSSLIIVKLPFAAPDPVNEYERSLCGSELEFKEQYVFADMIIRLKQGIGRLIRREDDTGLISILDFRMRLGAKYRSKVLAALPEYRVTSSVKDIHAFFRNKKSEEYFTRISEK